MQANGISGIWATIVSLPGWQGFLIVVATAMAAAVVLRVGGDRLLRPFTERIPGDVDDIVFGGVHRVLYLTIVIGGTYLGLTLFDSPLAQHPSIEATTQSLVTLLWVVSLVRIGRRASRAVTDNRYIDRQVVPIFQNVWTAVVVGVGSFLLLTVWNIDVTPLLASAGIAGIVLGLAAKDTISNLFGSIALYLDGTYAVGDYVVLETGERGRVEDISVRSTVIRTRDDILVTVPNAVLNNAAIVNESTPKQKRRIRVPVGVAYGSDLDEVEAILLDVADDEDHVLDRPSPRARFREFGDSSLDYELLCWVANPALTARVTHNCNRAIYDRFNEADVEIPFPQREISVSGVDVDGLSPNGDDGESAVRHS